MIAESIDFVLTAEISGSPYSSFFVVFFYNKKPGARKYARRNSPVALTAPSFNRREKFTARG